MAACSAPPPPAPPGSHKEGHSFDGVLPDFPEEEDEWNPSTCLMDLRPCGKKLKVGTVLGCAYVSYMRKTGCLNMR